MYLLHNVVSIVETSVEKISRLFKLSQVYHEGTSDKEKNI